jgi:AraC-like DNA-binding protein
MASAFDPAVLRLWRLAEDLPRQIRRVLVLPARAAPPWPGDLVERREARWDLLGAHQHAVPTVIGCLAGVLRVATARRSFDLEPGEVLVVAPGAWHAQARLRSGSAQWGQGLVFGRSDVLIAEPERELSLLIPSEPSATLLRSLLEEPDAARRRTLAIELSRQCTTSRSVPKEVHSAVWRMGRRLWTSLHRPLRASDVLAAAGVGERQAHRLFVAHFGGPPKRVIRAQQLALAAELLREGSGVGGAAAACGFADRRAFTRAWRLAHGAAPSRSTRR